MLDRRSASLPGRAAAVLLLANTRAVAPAFPGRALATVVADRVPAWDDERERSSGVLLLDDWSSLLAIPETGCYIAGVRRFTEEVRRKGPPGPGRLLSRVFKSDTEPVVGVTLLYRMWRKKARSSLTNSSGCSKAGKCPPRSSSFQWRMSV